MTHKQVVQMARRMPRLRWFGTLLVLAAIIVVGLGLSMAHRDFGGIVLIALLGLWSTGAAISDFRYRTAYLTGAFLGGFVWYPAVLLPVTPLGLLMNHPHWGEIPHALIVLVLCIANAVFAVVLRPWIHPAQSRLPVRLTLALLYLMTLLLVLANIAWEMLQQPFTSYWAQLSTTLSLLLDGLGMSFGAFLLVVLSGYVTVPAAWLILAWLRILVDVPFDPDDVRRRILEAVDALHVIEGPPVDRQAIVTRTGLPRRIAIAFIERLMQAGELQCTAECGYVRD